MRFGISSQFILPAPLLLVVGLIAIAVGMPKLIEHNARETAEAQAVNLAQQYSKIRKYYADEIVAKVLKSSELRATHTHAADPLAIPAPATFIHDIRELVKDDDVTLRLFSPFPFKNRQDRVLDDYDKAAWAALSKDPDTPFVRQMKIGEHQVVKVGIADRMVSQVCVDCHNSHPDLERKGWKLGDLRGVFQITTTIEDLLDNGQHDSKLLMLLMVLGTAIIVAISMAISRRAVKSINRLVVASGQMEAKSYQPGGLTADSDRNDEIGDLVRVFDDMSREILNREAVLEDLVAQRTTELEDKNSRLTAINKRIAEELDLARTLQSSMLPQEFPSGADGDVFAFMEQAKEVGGDFYDVFEIDDRHLAITVADVSGKGVPAAFFMMVSRTLLRGVVESGVSPSRALIEINDALCQQNPMELFVTVFLGVLDRETGRFDYANGGHGNPLLGREDGTVEWLEGCGDMLLGIMEGLDYKQKSVQLAPGDSIFLCTDGVDEAFNDDGVAFGNDRLRGVIEELAKDSAGAPSAEEICTRVVQRVKDFAGDAEQSDDITVLALRRT
jgi:serine phosphatase RsbU (regulator of sigma subunit)